MPITASLVFAAGRGSRMEGYDGNKTLLPLIPKNSPYQGSHPILLEILQSLPPGPKGVVVNHREADVMAATSRLGVSYLKQPQLNGTGGALLAARPFLKKTDARHLLITMGDVPFVKRETYESLLRNLNRHHLTVLGFQPESKGRYGLLETEGKQIKGIIEWEYWHRLPKETQDSLSICNSGIYALRKEILEQIFEVLNSTPHLITKTINGTVCRVEEYFITDVIKPLDQSGRSVGFLVADTPEEVMGIDTPQALRKAQQIFQKSFRSTA
jgi:bifunctional UDP-N-acetylglucosamine pyrophosphorylase/glucosamine-1-phosphate N-acetyltransferase